MKPAGPLKTLIAAVAFAAASPVFAQLVIVEPTAPPPPPRVEVVPAPRAGYVWDGGHWRWDHGRYVWMAGHWRPVRVGHHWVPGHWAARGPNWHWIPGHWA